MASLDAFLADLDDLQDDEEDERMDDEEGAGEDGEDDDLDMMGEDDTKSVSGLLASAKMARLMQTIEAKMEADVGAGASSTGSGPATTDDMAGSSSADDSNEYELIVSCNEMVIEIDNEIEAIAKTVKDEYARRFPELDSLIPNPLDYARVVLKLGNEIEMSDVDLTGILPSATIMVVTVTASTTIGTPLPETTLAGVIESCEQVLTLSDNKQKMLALSRARWPWWHPTCPTWWAPPSQPSSSALLAGCTSSPRSPQRRCRFLARSGATCPASAAVAWAPV